jgi:hypothetical protein
MNTLRNSKERRSVSDDLRSDWATELNECRRRRLSLRRKIERAERAGKTWKAADLEAQYKAITPDPAWPKKQDGQRLAFIDSPCFGKFAGLTADEEWDKSIPRCLRSPEGRAAWETLIYWRRASDNQKRNLEDKLGELWHTHSDDDAAYALYRIFHRLKDEDREFFSKLGIALGEEKQEHSAFERIKRDLIIYRESLNWWLRPGQPRHTIAEIKQIAAPENEKITREVFANMVREFKVPHLPSKSGKASANYGRLTKNGERR